MRVAGIVVLMAAGLWLAGCVDNGGGNYRYYNQPSSSSTGRDSPSVYNTSAGVKAALKDGCRRRYPDDERRYRQCIEGDRHSEDALIDGCRQRYPDDPRKLRECMRAAY